MNTEPKPQLESKPLEPSLKGKDFEDWEDEKPSHPNKPISMKPE